MIIHTHAIMLKILLEVVLNQRRKMEHLLVIYWYLSIPLMLLHKICILIFLLCSS